MLTERKSFLRQVRTFILESNAVASLQSEMMMAEVVEPFRFMFKSLDIEYKLDNIKEDWYKDVTEMFYKKLDRIRK